MSTTVAKLWGVGELLDIIEETPDFIVLNKPGNLVCHPTKGTPYSSLIGRLRLYYQDSEVEPRFVNRLDRETSGIVVVSKNRPAHKVLCRELEDSRKLYWAVVEGTPATSGTIEQPLGKAENSPVVVKQAVREDGKPSITHWELLATARDVSLLQLRLETGRMHQLRVHLQWLGHPIVGDKLYGRDEMLYLEFVENGWTAKHVAELGAERQLLSAVELRTRSHHWRVEAPSDITEYRAWAF